MKIVERNVITGQEKVVMKNVCKRDVAYAKRTFIERLYRMNRYADYVIDIKP